MPRNRTPLAKAKLTGQVDAKPERYANRVEPKADEIGNAPDNFDEPLIKLWNEIKSDIPWLKSSDRLLLGMACRLQHKVDTESDLSMSAYSQLRMTLNAMGASPVDRNKITDAELEDEYDPLDEFIN